MANDNIVIVLDPGHVKGYNVGANKKYVEGEKMFALATYLKVELEKYEGFEVYSTRNAVTEDPSLKARGQMAKDKKAKVFLSLHTNAAKGAAYGVVIYRSIFRNNSEQLADVLGYAIADLINNTVPKTNYRGCLTLKSPNSNLDYYGVIRHSVGEGVDYTYIIEHAFHSTLEECNWLDNDSNLRALAVVEASTMAKFFGKKLKSGGTTTPTTPTKPVDNKYCLYTVKAGDSMWNIAKQTLGDPTKYTEILKFNNMTTNTVINPGDVIKIPGINTIVTEIEREYKVVANDSWWGIALKTMGSGAKYKELAAYNGKTTNSVINPGDILKIPK